MASKLSDYPSGALLREVGHEMQPSISAGQKPTIEVVALSCSFIRANARGMEAACLLICWDTKQMQETKCRVAFQLLQRLPLADSQTLTAQPPDLKLPSLLPEKCRFGPTSMFHSSGKRRSIANLPEISLESLDDRVAANLE